MSDDKQEARDRYEFYRETPEGIEMLRAARQAGADKIDTETGRLETWAGVSYQPEVDGENGTLVPLDEEDDT